MQKLTQSHGLLLDNKSPGLRHRGKTDIKGQGVCISSYSGSVDPLQYGTMQLYDER